MMSLYESRNNGRHECIYNNFDSRVNTITFFACDDAIRTDWRNLIQNCIRSDKALEPGVRLLGCHERCRWQCCKLLKRNGGEEVATCCEDEIVDLRVQRLVRGHESSFVEHQGVSENREMEGVAWRFT